MPAFSGERCSVFLGLIFGLSRYLLPLHGPANPGLPIGQGCGLDQDCLQITFVISNSWIIPDVFQGQFVNQIAEHILYEHTLHEVFLNSRLY